MGLIKAAVGSIGGTLADQWKDFFACDALDSDWLVVKGYKHGSGRSSNKHGEDNVITNGANIIVADGQCAMIVEQGKVLELCAEPGGYTYDNTLSPSVFVGDMKEGLKQAALEAWERFKFGGGVGRDQRIYFFNTKEIIGNKYGTMNPVPFQVTDMHTGRKLMISLRCNGEYSYRIVNPMALYTNVTGNIESAYNRENLDSQLKSELLTALQPAFAELSKRGVTYPEIPGYTFELADILNDILSKRWTETRGIKVENFGINSIAATPEDEQMLKDMQKSVYYTDPSLAAGGVAAAQMDAMRTAAANEGGAAVGLMGMNMAAGAGAGAAGLFEQAARQQAQGVQTPYQMQQGTAGTQAQGQGAFGVAGTQGAAQGQGTAGTWTCSCGATSQGNFCMQCGAKKPEAPVGGKWFCPQCGTQCEGNFCIQCGTKRP